jgi:hypothetical protein
MKWLKRIKVKNMKEALIDTSGNHVGIVIGEGLTIKILNKDLKMKFGKPIHMKELKTGERFTVLRTFNQIFYEKGFTGKAIELYSINVNINDGRFWTLLIKEFIHRRIETVNADYEVQERLKKFVNALLLRQLTIYLLKETLQFADIVAYANSHHHLVKNIWKNVPLRRGSM